MTGLVTKACYILFGTHPLFVSLIYFLFLSGIFIIAKKIKHKEIFLFIVSILPAVLFALRLILNDFFLSDDFDHFVLVTKYSYLEILIKGFLADNLWAFHRLFTAFLAFKFVFSIFGANYYVFVVVNLLLHIVNSYLLFVLLKKFIKDIYIVFVSIFIYSTFYLTWISNIHELLAAFFFLSTTLIAFKILFEKGKNNKRLQLLSLVTYILGIYSKEIVFIFPFCFSLLLIFYNNYRKKINIIQSILSLKAYFVISFIYLAVFVYDFGKFSNFESNSGYDTVFKFSNVIDHLVFYINDRLPIFSGTIGLVIFILLILFFDIYRKKAILTPLFLSFLALIFPVLFLSKATAYYGFLPFIFIIIGTAVIFETSKLKNIIFVIFASMSLVFVFRHNIPTQENCFLIQYPRIHPRKQAVEDLLKGSPNQSDEARWVKENNYLKYFNQSK